MARTYHSGHRVTGIYRGLEIFLAPVLKLLLRRHWDGIENLPREGGFILSPNHLSNFDPVAMGYFMVMQGYEMRYLAKSGIFTVPVVGPIMRKWGMVPVQRGTSDATEALSAAREALEAGEVIGLYPEGTLTRDPAYWPMTIKTGAARLALDTGMPLIPVVQWGPQDFMERYSARMRIFHKTDVYVRVLPALDLSDFAGKDSSDHEAVHEVTRRLHEALTQGLAKLRDSAAPDSTWDMKIDGPAKETMKSLAKWRIALRKSVKRQDILPPPRSPSPIA